ncbi:unnamed protein product [Prorocentrum cordatum]|uniref:Uncharacterized protein n=1 Tax=Prorocentrum cordatum TaxID=2364126 RepID=A0ABN9XMY4_9DINO|nr:unnamed protein product [Polarella glacialis]
MGHLGWAKRGMPRGKARVPFYHVTLRPGDGLAVPSARPSGVVSRDSRRLAINAFFEPKFGRTLSAGVGMAGALRWAQHGPRS